MDLRAAGVHCLLGCSYILIIRQAAKGSPFVNWGNLDVKGELRTMPSGTKRLTGHWGLMPGLEL